MRIVWNEKTCASIGMCEGVAPELFEVGDDGALHILNERPAECHRALLEDAVRACPTGSLSVEEV